MGEENKKKKGNCAWLTIALSFLMVLFGLGLWSTKSYFIRPITSALEISRSAFSIADTMRYIATAIVNIFFGTLINKFGSKKLICAGFTCLTIAAVLYALAESVWVFYVGGLFLGTGLSWTSTTIVGYIVNKVSSKNSGTIMGFVLAANGIGGAVATEIVAPFINNTSDEFGYRKAYFLMAAIFVALLIIFLIFYREPIQDQESVASTTNKKVRGQKWIGIESKDAFKKPYFYFSCVCVLFTGMIMQSVSGVSIAHMGDVGIDAEYVKIVGEISFIALALFKFLNGFIYDKCGLRITLIVDYVAAISVTIILFFLTNSPFGMILAMLYAILSGLALPLETVIIPIYTRDVFGEKSFNKILGILVSMNQIGYAIGGPIISVFYDLLGGYQMAFAICGVIMVAVLIGQQLIINSAQKVKREIMGIQH